MTHERESRRRFLKYAGATAALVGASALGLDYLLNLGKEGNQPSATSITQDKTPPTIQDYKLVPNPDKVQNDKPYELDLSFTAEDLESALDLSAVSLAFEPIYPPEIPKAAYTPEPNSFQTTYTLNPSSVSPDRKKATFSQPIAGFVGGKQYRSTIKVKDSAGNEAESSVDGPYVREFENLGKSNKINLGAHYLFFKNGGWDYWDTGNGNPLLGNYDSSDSYVIAKHIDWATGHGINFLPMIWFGPAHYSSSKLRHILSHPLIKDIKFCIFYDSTQLSGPQLGSGPWNVDDPSIKKKLLDGLDYLIQNDYFNHPSYFTYRGAHLIYYWGSLSWKGHVGSMTTDLRKKAKESGIDLFIVGDPVEYYAPDLSRIKPFDGITQFLNNSVTDAQVNQNLEKMMDANYREWSSLAKSVGVSFIPSAIPGYRKPIRPDFLTLPRDPKRFKNQLEIGKKYIDPDLNMFFLTSFNDWTEDHEIEPSEEEKFAYLQIVRDSFA